MQRVRVYHGATSQEYEAWHSFCFVHTCNICQVIKVVPDVVLQKEHSCPLVTILLTQLAAVLQHFLARPT